MEIEFSKDDKRDYVAVPKALLEMCLGLLNEFDDHDYKSVNPESNDLELARAQLRCAIAE